jgi:prophage regulatory protein
MQDGSREAKTSKELVTVFKQSRRRSLEEGQAEESVKRSGYGPQTTAGDRALNTAEGTDVLSDPMAILLAEIRGRGARMLRLRDVMERTTLARNTIHEMEVRGEFPKRRRLAGNGDRVGWLESEIEDWIKTRPTEEEARRGRS